MAVGSSRRVLPLVYLLVVTGVCVLLILLGFVLDRLPGLPASATRRYQGLMLATISRLTRPVDGWMDQPSDPVAGGVAGESAP